MRGSTERTHARTGAARRAAALVLAVLAGCASAGKDAAIGETDAADATDTTVDSDTDTVVDTDPVADTDSVADTGPVADTDPFVDTDTGLPSDSDSDTPPEDTDPVGPDTDLPPGDTWVHEADASDLALLAQCATATGWTTPERRHLRLLTTCVGSPDGAPCPDIGQAVQLSGFGRGCSDEVFVCGVAFSHRVNWRNPADSDDTGTVPIETGWDGDTGTQSARTNSCCYTYLAEPAWTVCD